MNIYQLQSDDFISDLTGVHISYHYLRWGNDEDTVSLNQSGGNIIYHSLFHATKPHTHQFSEICLILNGRIKHSVNGSIQALVSGNIVFIRPSDRHYFLQYESEDCELINFAVKLNSLLDISKFLGNDEFMKRYTATVLPSVFKMSKLEMDDKANQILGINTLQITDFIQAKIKAKVLLLDFFTRYFLFDSIYEKTHAEIPEWLEKLYQKMKQRDKLKNGIDAMLKLAPCTHEHLCKVCKIYYKETPTEIVNKFRIQEAARCLAEDDDKIYSIATELGFKSISYFHSKFKTHYGVSPAVYRIQSRQSNLIPY